MDLIAQLSSQLGVDPTQAQALAGAVLGGVKDQVGEHVGTEAAQSLDAQVPELSTWQQQASQTLEQPKATGGLLGGLAGGLGGQLLGAVGGEEAKQVAQLGAILEQIGVDPGHVALVGPMVLAFLKERMSEEWVTRALAVAPLLSGAAKGGTSAAALGALGGLFGGDA